MAAVGLLLRVAKSITTGWRAGRVRRSPRRSASCRGASGTRGIRGRVRPAGRDHLGRDQRQVGTGAQALRRQVVGRRGRVGLAGAQLQHQRFVGRAGATAHHGVHHRPRIRTPARAAGAGHAEAGLGGGAHPVDGDRPGDLLLRRRDVGDGGHPCDDHQLATQTHDSNSPELNPVRANRRPAPEPLRQACRASRAYAPATAWLRAIRARRPGQGDGGQGAQAGPGAGRRLAQRTAAGGEREDASPSNGRIGRMAPSLSDITKPFGLGGVRIASVAAGDGCVLVAVRPLARPTGSAL